MSSVGVTWNGSCELQPIVADLIGHLRRVAAKIEEHRCLPRFAWTRGEDGKERRTIVQDEPAPPEVYDGYTLRGRIAFLPDEAVLDGIVFRLFDPRELYDDHVGFVFARTKGAPGLRGHLVDVVPADRLTSEVSRRYFAGADFLLCQPGVHLRYVYEKWMDLLLAWVRLYFVPDLWYWRHEDLPRFDRYLPYRFRPSRLEARDRMFGEILARLEQEIEGARY